MRKLLIPEMNMDEQFKAPVRKRLRGVALRGFGTISGSFATYGKNASVSALTISCENEAKADLVLAKYLGDLGKVFQTEAVLLKSDCGDIPAHHAADQGYITAFRANDDVVICAAPSPEELSSVYRAELGSISGEAQFVSQAKVPMYLDRWDKHGFIFYYSVFMDPPASDPPKPFYNYSDDFAFAKDHNTGMAIWDDESANDTAEGLMNIPWWEWSAKETTAANIPLHINSSDIPTTWLLNRYRDQTVQKMPQFSGNFYRIADPYLGGNGTISWGAQEAEDAELGLVQSSVKRFAAKPNVVGWLEPHSELGHGKQQLFLEYGPVADASYQDFLRERYKNIKTLDARWHGGRGKLRSWPDVKAPELADFLGWGPDAFDLTGAWRVHYEDAPAGKTYTNDDLRGLFRRPVPTIPAPDEWFTPAFDDSNWGTLIAPGNDRTMYMEKRPAVYRRRFDMPHDWRASRGKIWLYVWNLNMAEQDKMAAYVNDKKVGESIVPFYTPQWAAFEVSDALRDGSNHIAMRLPNGFLGYRVYLSPTPPNQYPHLGAEMNAQWADYADWTGWLRFEGVRRGTEMIRQVDPDRPITFMSPDVYVDHIKVLCERYGGHFHDTGLMAGLWCDLYPMLARGSNLAFDLEPGGPSANAEDFRLYMGRYLTEGIQGISYFMHIGDVMWKDDVRKQYEAYQPMLNLVGKCHIPKAEVAILYSQRCERLTGYPWGSDPNTSLGCGFWYFNIAANLLTEFPRDGVTEIDFGNGNVDPYKVIVDTNTSIMDETLVSQIEAWVKNGGIFVSFVHTGRHTPTDPETWPMSRLTGYRVDRIEKYSADGKVPDSEWSTLKPAQGQDIFRSSNWDPSIRANGLRLSAAHSDCHNLMLWEDGSVAIGMRPLGKGHVVQVGCKFTDDKIPDRIDIGLYKPSDDHLTTLLSDLLGGLGMARVPGRTGNAGDPILMRHSVSNDGLYDVWFLYNRDKAAQKADLIFKAGFNPASCIDVISGQTVPVTRTDAESSLKGLTFGSLETRAFITPRNTIESAPLNWLELQRNWWRGTTKPEKKWLPTPEELQLHSAGLSEDWGFQALDSVPADQIAKMTDPAFDDSHWERIPLGMWGLSDYKGVKHAMLRKRITVPKKWKAGEVALWIQSWTGTTFVDRGRVYVDGRVIRDFDPDGVRGNVLDGALKPGSTHVIAMEIEGIGVLNGIRANAWLSHLPDAQANLDLSGEWIPSRDVLHEDAPIQLPGPWDTQMARRTIHVDDAQKKRNVHIEIIAEGPIVGVIINGSYVRRHHHGIGERTILNVTRWIKFGQENEITVVRWWEPGKATIKAVKLRFYDKGVYA